LEEPIAGAIAGNDLVVAAVLSGNRNFEGRINPLTQANYLASPPLVVAYALAGTVDIDLATEPIGTGKQGQPVYLRDIWPSSQEIYDTISRSIDPEMFRANYAEVLTGNETWNRIESGDAEIYAWNPDSTYIQEPPYFEQLGQGKALVHDIRGARVLAVLGDSITTDHISPAGAIPASTPAGRYLIEHGVAVSDFNSYGSRRGNDRVMTRGTFANIRLKNQMVAGVEGGMTRHFPDDETMSIFDAAMKYKEEGIPLIVLAGKEYGTGSSRDWAAKGAMLLGVRAVIAESFERIHRSNLAGMGILPLQFKPGESWKSLGLTGEEVLDIQGLEKIQSPGGEVSVQARRPDGSHLDFQVLVRLNTALEVDYYHNGGIMNTVLLDMLS
jgi:aconitate hydratase